MYREEWLNRATDLLRPYFKDRGYEIPELIRVSCGWPSKGGLSPTRRKLGECWDGDTTFDGVVQIFISPYLFEKVDVLGVLVHELISSCVPKDDKKEFTKAMQALGMEGQASSYLPGLILGSELAALDLPEYPHAKVDRLVPITKAQSTRLKKLICPANDIHDDDYILRGTMKALAFGLPVCPCGKVFEMDEVEEKIEEEINEDGK